MPWPVPGGDERQQLIAQRSWALAGKVTMFAAFAGVTIAVAAGASSWWPFAVTFAADDANDGPQMRSPVSH